MAGPTTRISDLGYFKFGGVRVPFQTLAVRGGIRDHVHEFPHAQGGAPEKMGRKLYEIDVQTQFTSGLSDPDLFYLWPRQLNELCRSFENQATAEVTLPDIGTIKAYAVNWTRTLSANFLNGSTVSITFREDRAEDFLVEKILDGTATNLVELNTTLQIEGDLIEPKPSIFDAIDQAANAVRAILDTNDLYGGLLATKIEGLVNLLEEADARWEAFQDADNIAAIEALMALWEATVNLASDIFGTGAELKTWTVPREMSAADVSTELYNDTDHQTDILNLNPTIEDGNSIPAGTKIKYYHED